MEYNTKSILKNNSKNWSINILILEEIKRSNTCLIIECKADVILDSR
jgi:hypothetical protein